MQDEYPIGQEWGTGDRALLHPKTVFRPLSKIHAADNLSDNPSKLACISQKRWLRVPHCARSSPASQRGRSQAALDCAHRTSTASPCAFCEQEGHIPYSMILPSSLVFLQEVAEGSPHCARPTRAFSGRALREQRGPSATSPLLAAPETISLPPSVL